jgi:hypothetical protein
LSACRLSAYAAYYLVVWLMVRRWAPVTPGRLQLTILAFAVVAFGLLVTPPEFLVARVIAFLALAAGTALVAWPRLRTLHQRGDL